MKKSVIILTIILVALGLYIYYDFFSTPNNDNELCLKKVQKENSFCETINEEQCKYYQNISNSIPNGGNCRWIEETSLCVGSTSGCD